MLSTTLPLLPFSSSTLPKKEWVGNHQEKKGRPINLDVLAESMRVEALRKAGEIVDDSSSDSGTSIDTREYMSEDSWNSDEEYEDDGGVGLSAHIKTLLPEKAVVGKPQPKLVKPPPPPKPKNTAPGFFGRQWIRFLEWREYEKARRMHYMYREFEKKVKEHAKKVEEDIEKEIEAIKEEVIKAAYELKKRIRINSLAKKQKDGQLARYVEGVAQRKKEAQRMDFFCANLQRWAVEKHDHKIEMEQLRRAEQLEKERKDREKAERERKIAAQAKEDEQLGIDIDITQQIASMGRGVGSLAGVNVYDPVAAELELSMKNKKSGADDFKHVSKDPILLLKLLNDVDFKKMKRGGVTADGKKMPVFDHPDLMKTRHVVELRCERIGERGALSLAAEFIRGACPMIEVLDLSRNQIQTRGLGRLLHGMKLANLMSLKRLILVSNDLTPRSMEYLRDAFNGGTFPSLEILDLRGNEIGDDGVDILLRSFHLKHFEYLRELLLQSNKLTDVAFEKLIKTLSSLQETNMPFVERIALESNAISSKVKRKFHPLPHFVSC